MKKCILILMAILALLSALAGCGKREEMAEAVPEMEGAQQEDASLPEDTIAAVLSGEEEIPVYIELYYDETGSFHVPFYERLDEVENQIPVIAYEEDLSIGVSDQYACWGIEVYDLSGEHVAGIGDWSALPSVNGGEYYFSAYVVEARAGETREYNGYHCVFRMTIPHLDPLLTVISGGEETVAPKYWYCGMSWEESESGGGWLFADGMGLYDDPEGMFVKLPEVRLDGDFSLRRGENVTLGNGFSVFDDGFEKVGVMKEPEELNSLGSGTYYIVMPVFRNETEIHQGETGYDGYHCGFKLIVP